MAKGALLFTVMAIVGLTLGTTVALAQTETPTVTATATPTPTPAPTPEVSQIIFPWAFEPGGFYGNWSTGLVYFLLGIVGALVTVYLFLGEFLPSMGGKAEYELLKLELKDLKERRERALTAREKYARGESELTELSKARLEVEDHLTDDYDRAIERLEKQLSQERWRLFLLGFPMYILLGGFFATAFATNFLQAILIGFGWTAIADRIGLEREMDVRKGIRDAEIKKIEDAARQEKEALQAKAAQQQAKVVEQQAKIAELQGKASKQEEAIAKLRRAMVE